MFYCHNLSGGGAERLWACLATAFHERGYQVSFVQDVEAQENRHNLAAAIPLHTIGRSNLTSTLRLADILREERPDVALGAVGGSNTKLMIARRLAKAPTKAILTYHGYNEWRTGLLSFLTFLALPWLSSGSARTVAVSAGLRDQLIKRWGAKADKTVTILNPVFFPQAAKVPSAAELAARDDVVLGVGRFVAEKDFVTLVRAFARLDRPKARLVILGKGELQGSIEAEIAKLGIKDRVSLPGYSAEPWVHYASAKCFVSSSVSDSFGNVIVEAMAYGLPIVATACDGPQEILSHGVHGQIVPLRDDVQLARAISQTLDNPGDPAARRARAEQFSFGVRIPAYISLIEDVLAETDQQAKPGLASFGTVGV